MKPGVTVIVLNYNGRAFLEKFLPFLLQTRYDNFKIVVADNGSLDGSLTLLRTKFPEVTVLDFGENLGFTKGNNKAIESVDTPYYALVNSDIEVDPDWLGPLVDMMESQPLAAAIQPKIKAWHSRNSFEYAGASGGFLDWLAYPFCRGRIFGNLEEDRGQYDEPCEVAWASGACVLIRKTVTDRIGLFEPEFFAHMEEIDFCWRAKNYGYKVLVCPQSTVWHVGGGTLSQDNPKKLYLNLRNSLMCMMLNLPGHQILPKIFLRLILDGVFSLKLLAQGKAGVIPWVLKAHFHFYARIPYTLKRRRHYYPEATPASMPITGILQRLIIFRHFLLGVNTFKEVQGLSGYAPVPSPTKQN
jgi:GT2 family glycosyltransferase